MIASFSKSKLLNFSKQRDKKPSQPPTRIWMVPGESQWELWQETPSGEFEVISTLAEDLQEPPPHVAMVGLPARWVTCQLFWLETTDEKAVQDLLRMQCERRQLLRQKEVWTHRILRREENRMLAQVLILQNSTSHAIEVDTAALFEAHPRVLVLPPRTLSVRRSLGTITLMMTDEKSMVYFQPLPHRDLTPECLQDVKAAMWMATAQKWVDRFDALVLVGGWTVDAARMQATMGMKVEFLPSVHLQPPNPPMELTPPAVGHQRLARTRKARIQNAILALGLLYLIFVVFQTVTFLFSSAANTRLKSQLDAIMPEVEDMQNTARWMDALNPALDTKTYPLELLHRIMGALPTQGVRLTKLDITGNRIEIGGESTTAREAFDYVHALEIADSLNHITWDEAPQPVPLPNDTTRFTIQGTIEGAYNDTPEEP